MSAAGENEPSRGADDASHGLPVLSALVFLAAVAAVAAGWRIDHTTQLWPEYLVLATLGLWLAHRVILICGYGFQDRLSEKFLSALKEDGARTRIGGVLWTAVDGEFRRVTYASDRGMLFDADSTPDARHQNELIWLRRRRWAVICCVVVSGFGAIQPDYIHSGLMPPVATIALFGLAICVLWELLYQLGFQRIYGAMVLDPLSAGRAEVEGQKAHGDAGLSTEIEALAAASRGMGTKSRLHDQEF